MDFQPYFQLFVLILQIFALLIANFKGPESSIFGVGGRK
jgi:hypothetical protein